MSEPRRRVELDGTREERDGLLSVLAPQPAQVPETAERIVPRGEITGRLAHGALRHVLEELRPQRDRDGLRDLVACVERVVERRVPAVRPDVLAAFGEEQLGRDPHPLLDLSEAAYHEVLGAELPADRDRVDRLALVRERRVPGDDRELVPHRQARDEILDEPVREILGIRVALCRLERHDRDRRPGRGRRLCRNGLTWHVDEEGVDRVGDVLDVLRADVLERRRVPGFVADELGDADAARARKALETCRDVDPGSVDPVGVHDDLAAVDSHPELHPVVGRILLVRLQNELLEAQRRVQRRSGAAVLEQEVVAR
jgi:hypothetical protein